MKLKIKKLKQEAHIPSYQTKEAAGFDLHAIEDAILNPNERKLIGIGSTCKSSYRKRNRR